MSLEEIFRVSARGHVDCVDGGEGGVERFAPEEGLKGSLEGSKLCSSCRIGGGWEKRSGNYEHDLRVDLANFSDHADNVASILLRAHFLGHIVGTDIEERNVGDSVCVFDPILESNGRCCAELGGAVAAQHLARRPLGESHVMNSAFGSTASDTLGILLHEAHSSACPAARPYPVDCTPIVCNHCSQGVKIPSGLVAFCANRGGF
mmetsp:Transcript_27775/g.64661  ORF Transcript_27775/g.64661 Transcript_27775/m.64661 type:complete len:205 (-) Transcript_27775:1583-2197(-)